MMGMHCVDIQFLIDLFFVRCVTESGLKENQDHGYIYIYIYVREIARAVTRESEGEQRTQKKKKKMEKMIRRERFWNKRGGVKRRTSRGRHRRRNRGQRR
jgi:hypothetical protein